MCQGANLNKHISSRCANLQYDFNMTALICAGMRVEVWWMFVPTGPHVAHGCVSLRALNGLYKNCALVQKLLPSILCSYLFYILGLPVTDLACFLDLSSASFLALITACSHGLSFCLLPVYDPSLLLTLLLLLFLNDLLTPTPNYSFALACCSGPPAHPKCHQPCLHNESHQHRPSCSWQPVLLWAQLSPPSVVLCTQPQREPFHSFGLWLGMWQN